MTERQAQIAARKHARDMIQDLDMLAVVEFLSDAGLDSEDEDLVAAALKELEDISDELSD